MACKVELSLGDWWFEFIASRPLRFFEFRVQVGGDLDGLMRCSKYQLELSLRMCSEVVAHCLACKIDLSLFGMFIDVVYINSMFEEI